MKGTHVLGAVTVALETKKEQWTQGEIVDGQLLVSNKSAETLPLSSFGISLAIGEFKKVFARHPQAFKIQNTLFLEKDEVLAPGVEKVVPFQFQLPVNSAITDKKISYFLLYGKEGQSGHLQMNVRPHTIFLKVVELLDHFYRFKNKEMKTSKDAVEFKLAPPQSRDFTNVEMAYLNQKLNGEDLQLDFHFDTRKINLLAPSTTAEKESKTYNKNLTKKEYLLGKDMPNQDHLLKVLEEVIGDVKMKGMFK